jgi:hypothetical protein
MSTRGEWESISERIAFDGGIYMASNIDDSSKVWNSQIQPTGNEEEISGKHGDMM